jgi:hypothetical protein
MEGKTGSRLQANEPSSVSSLSTSVTSPYPSTSRTLSSAVRSAVRTSFSSRRRSSSGTVKDMTASEVHVGEGVSALGGPDADHQPGQRDRLGDRGLKVAETRLWHHTLKTGEVVAYCVQEELPGGRLCSRLLRTENEEWAAGFFKRFLDTVDRVVAPDLGLDAQASNWVEDEGELVYLDITTPMMRDDRGRELLDVRLFFTSLPWAMRDAVRISMAKSIFDKFYSVRGVVLDFLGNLHKERLDGLIPGFLELANPRLDSPITAEEVAAYYKSDAQMWELIQRLRKADRFWHNRIRRRTYPFLLPPDIDR